MRRRKFTEAFVASLTPDGRDQRFCDTQLSGFELRITPNGRKILYVRCRVAGRRPSATLCYWPDLSVPKGRERALQALADLRQGVDPTTRAKAAAARKVTLADLAARWVDEHVKPKLKPRTAADYERLLKQRVLPVLGHLPVVQIEHDDVNRLHLSLARFPRRANYAVQVPRVSGDGGDRLPNKPRAAAARRSSGRSRKALPGR